MISPTDSTFSQSHLSTCSSRDSIQHWVDSLDVEDSDNNNVINDNEGARHQEEQGELDQTVVAASGSNLEYQNGDGGERTNIPGYGQPLHALHRKKGKVLSFISLIWVIPSGWVTKCDMSLYH